MALDTLVAYRAPAPNMAPLAQIAAPVLPDAPTHGELGQTLATALNEQPTPRVRKTVDTILAHATEILTRKDRRVSVSDLPRLFLQPDTFPNAAAILSRHETVVSRMRQSVQDVLKQLPPRT